MTLDKLKPGMIVYSVRRHRAGNTSRTTVGTYPVRITSIHEHSEKVYACINGNPERAYPKRDWSKWRLKQPMLIPSAYGIERLATREEIKQAKLKNTTL